MKVDKHISDDLTKHLFETQDPTTGAPFHLDLVAINIQRGRDHGLPSYTKIRQFCGLPPVNSWQDMAQVVDPEAVEVYRRFYKFVDDVDLFTAMISEIKKPSDVVGPTIKCVVGLQFRDLKFGDRFWYETDQAPMAFTTEQLKQIHGMTLSRVLCRNMMDTPKVQTLALLSTKFPK
jgi:peroxidase